MRRIVLLLAAVAFGCNCGTPASTGDAGNGNPDSGSASDAGNGTTDGGGPGNDAGSVNDAGTSSDAGNGTTDAGSGADGGSTIKWVFVIPMENLDWSTLNNNINSAPYIRDTLLPNYAHSTNYQDLLLNPNLPSEPHYIQMEAGTPFSFTTDADPSASNSTSSTAHIASQIVAAGTGITWMSYQEDIAASTTGLCPVASSGFYAAKHDPFVFFRDVSFDAGVPSKTNPYCVAHHQPFSAFQADLANGRIGTYTFITPNLCDDMHGAGSCTNGCTTGGSTGCISAGNTWLSNNLPPLISFVNANNGVIFLVWDEAESTTTNPFFAIGPHVKTGYTSTVAISHQSLVKSIDEILGLPVLAPAAGANDFSDLFQPGYFP